MQDKEDETKIEKEKLNELVSNPTSKDQHIKKEVSELDRKDMFKKLNDLKTEVSLLRTKLNEINSKKEALFEKKEKYKKEIVEIISDINSSKSKRNSLTNEVKSGKNKREELNKQIKGKIIEIKKLSEKKKDIEKKHNIKGNPSKIKEQIDFLESKIETEVMSFKKEQELMKTIKELKKQFIELKNISDVWEEMHGLSKEVEKIKQRADETHRKIQSRAKESQVKHENVVTRAKDIDDLRTKEKDAFERFSMEKKKFIEINNQLKNKLIEINEIDKVIHKFKAENKKEKRKKENNILKDKEKEIQDKMKKGGKLTTEDILIFQKSFERN